MHCYWRQPRRHGQNKRSTNKMTPYIVKKTRNPAVSRVSWPYHLSPKASFWLPVAEWQQSYTCYGDAAISNFTINVSIPCRNSAHVDDGCPWLCLSKFGQTTADRDMDYRKSSNRPIQWYNRRPLSTYCLAWKQLQIGTNILLVITSTSDELLRGVNIVDLEWP